MKVELCLLLSVLVLSCSGLRNVPDPNSEVSLIIEKHLNAIGGEKRIRSIDSFYIKVIDNQTDYSIEMSAVENVKFTKLIDYGHSKYLEIYNNGKGIECINGNKNIVPESELWSLNESTYLIFLYEAQERGWELGIKNNKDTIGNIQLSCLDPIKKVETIYHINSKTYLLEKTETSQFNHIVIFENYKTIEGIKFPFKQRIIQNGSVVELNTVKLDLNVEFSEQLFNLDQNCP